MAKRSKRNGKASAPGKRKPTIQDVHRAELKRAQRVTREVVVRSRQLKRAIERADRMLLETATWLLGRAAAAEAMPAPSNNVEKNGVQV